MAVSSLPARSPQDDDEAEPEDDDQAEDDDEAEDENEDEEGAMATLTAWKFETPTGADAVLLKLEQLQSRGLIELHDSAVVSWPEGRKKPWTRESESATGRGALGGGFWGLLFGLIFFVPLLGAAIGAATGALVGSLREVGISDDFIREVREKVTPGTSALFLLSSDAVYDKIAPELPDIKAELISTNMSEEQEAQLRQAFGLEADET
jgi:uncharacterized membrane protein